MINYGVRMMSYSIAAFIGSSSDRGSRVVSPAGYIVPRGRIVEGFMYSVIFRGMMQAKQGRVESWIEGKGGYNGFQ